jgi:hypothetical protein
MYPNEAARSNTPEDQQAVHLYSSAANLLIKIIG